MKIKIQTLAHGRRPARMSEGASGYDIFACMPYPLAIPARQILVVPCGFRMELPRGYEAQIRSRSGLSAKKGIFCLNGVGTIDSDYRGEVGAVMANFTDVAFTVEPEMRIAQMVICKLPDVSIEEVADLEISERGENGYGSTGV